MFKHMVSGGEKITKATEGVVTGALEEFPPSNYEGEDAPVVQPSSTRFGMIPVTIPKIGGCQPIILDNSIEGKPRYLIFIHDQLPFKQDIGLDIVNILCNACSDTTVEFLLSSPGGSLDAGCQISAAMATTKAHTITRAIGWCCSATALIWTNGKEKHIEPGGYVMFHLSSYVDGGNAEDIRRHATDSVEYVKEVALLPLIAQGILLEEELCDLIEKRIDVYIDPKTFNERMRKPEEVSNAA